MPLFKNRIITDFQLQVPFELQPKFKYDGKTVRAITYVADFVLYYANGIQEIIDIKGMSTDVAEIKRKMFMYKYPDLTYKWLTYSKIDGGWCETDTVKKARAERKKK